MSLAAIRARLEAATPGPWDDWSAGTLVGPNGFTIADVRTPADAAFIAAAPSDIERLLALIDGLRAAAVIAHDDKIFDRQGDHRAGTEPASCFLCEALARLDSEGSPL